MREKFSIITSFLGRGSLPVGRYAPLLAFAPWRIRPLCCGYWALPNTPQLLVFGVFKSYDIFKKIYDISYINRLITRISVTTAKIHFKVATILYGVTSHLDRKKKLMRR